MKDGGDVRPQVGLARQSYPGSKLSKSGLGDAIETVQYVTVSDTVYLVSVV